MRTLLILLLLTTAAHADGYLAVGKGATGFIAKYATSEADALKLCTTSGVGCRVIVRMTGSCIAWAANSQAWAYAFAEKKADAVTIAEKRCTDMNEGRCYAAVVECEHGPIETAIVTEYTSKRVPDGPTELGDRSPSGVQREPSILDSFQDRVSDIWEYTRERAALLATTLRIKRDNDPLFYWAVLAALLIGLVGGYALAQPGLKKRREQPTEAQQPTTEPETAPTTVAEAAHPPRIAPKPQPEPEHSPKEVVRAAILEQILAAREPRERTPTAAVLAPSRPAEAPQRRPGNVTTYDI